MGHPQRSPAIHGAAPSRAGGAGDPWAIVTRALASAAVGRWERSKAFVPDALPDTVAFRLVDALPAAWAVGGQDLQDALQDVLREWGAAGWVHLESTGRGLATRPHRVRFTAAGMAHAYAHVSGTTRRGRTADIIAVLATLAHQPEVASARAVAPWFADWFDAVCADAPTAQFARLGKQAGGEAVSVDGLADAVRLVARLLHHHAYDPRTLSGELFGDTKRIERLRPRAKEILLSIDPRWASAPPPDEVAFFAAYGEDRSPTFTSIAIAASIPDVANLRCFQPYAQLPGSVLAEVAAWCRARPVRPVVTTIENLRSFHGYLREPPVAAAIAAGTEVVVWTAGFASDDVLAFVRGAACPTRHWGDTDVHGLRIARQVARAAGDATLFRSTASWIRTRPRAHGRPLDDEHRAALQSLATARGGDAPSDPTPDMDTAIGLAAHAVLEVGHWFEQEVYYATDAIPGTTAAI